LAEISLASKKPQKNVLRDKAADLFSKKMSEMFIGAPALQ